MFKLLDNKWRNLIISELQDHIGKTQNSKEITNRNIYQGTEIEFLWIDEFEEEKLITGVVIETDYESSVFKVDSYENIYEVELEKITKILNNTKFKYNLNKLNNIDFL
jgi:phosphopentomutase